MPGFASTIIATLFIGGIQLIGIGVLGEYIMRIYIMQNQGLTTLDLLVILKRE